MSSPFANYDGGMSSLIEGRMSDAELAKFASQIGMNENGNFTDASFFAFNDGGVPSTTVSPSQLMLNGGNAFAGNNGFAGTNANAFGGQQTVTPPASTNAFQYTGQGQNMYPMAPAFSSNISQQVTPPALPAATISTPQVLQVAVTNMAPTANIQWQTNIAAAPPSKQKPKRKAKKLKTTPAQPSVSDYSTYINDTSNNTAVHGLGIMQSHNIGAAQMLPRGYQPSTNPAHAHLLQGPQAQQFTLPQAQQSTPPQGSFVLESPPATQMGNASLHTPPTIATAQHSSQLSNDISGGPRNGAAPKRKRKSDTTESSQLSQELFMVPDSMLGATDNGGLISPFTENFLQVMKGAGVVKDTETVDVATDKARIEWEAANAKREEDARVAAAQLHQDEASHFAALMQTPTSYDFSGLGLDREDALLPGFGDDLTTVDESQDDEIAAADSILDPTLVPTTLSPDDEALYQALRNDLSAELTASEQTTTTEGDETIAADVNEDVRDDGMCVLFGEDNVDMASLFGGDTTEEATVDNTAATPEPIKTGNPMNLCLPKLPAKSMEVSSEAVALTETNSSFTTAIDQGIDDLFGKFSEESFTSDEFNFDGTPRVESDSFGSFDQEDTSESETFDDGEEEFGETEVQPQLYPSPPQYLAPQQQMQSVTPPQAQQQYASAPQHQQQYASPPQQYAPQQQMQQTAHSTPPLTSAGPDRPLCALFLASNGQNCPYGTACRDRHYYLSNKGINPDTAVSSQINYMLANHVRDQDAWQEGLMVTSFKRNSRFHCKNCGQDKPVSLKNDGVRCTPCFKRWCNGSD